MQGTENSKGSALPTQSLETREVQQEAARYRSLSFATAQGAIEICVALGLGERYRAVEMALE
jgi:hypothetical protein